MSLMRSLVQEVAGHHFNKTTQTVLFTKKTKQSLFFLKDSAVLICKAFLYPYKNHNFYRLDNVLLTELTFINIDIIDNATQVINSLGVYVTS